MKSVLAYRIIWDIRRPARLGLSESTIFPTRINFDPSYFIRQKGSSPDLADLLISQIIRYRTKHLAAGQSSTLGYLAVQCRVVRVHNSRAES